VLFTLTSELFRKAQEKKYRSEEVTRTKIRTQLKPRLGKLIELINAIITQIKLAGSKVIIIIDGLDHPPTEAATRIFNDYGDLLSRPDCPIIYTIPIQVVYSHEFNQIRGYFDDRVILPNIAVIDMKGIPVQKNIELLKEAIERRMLLELIDTDALLYAIRMSGGVIRELVWIIRTSCR